MHSTCFLQSSCVCTSCPLPFPYIPPSPSTCCGCLLRLSTLEALHASNSLTAHTQTIASSKLHNGLLPLFFCLCTTIFHLTLHDAFLERGKISVNDFVIRWSSFSRWPWSCSVLVTGSFYGYFPASGWTYSCALVIPKNRDRVNEKLEKTQKEWRWSVASRPQSDTLVRDQCSSCGMCRTTARGQWCKQKEKVKRVVERRNRM